MELKIFFCEQFSQAIPTPSRTYYIYNLKDVFFIAFSSLPPGLKLFESLSASAALFSLWFISPHHHVLVYATTRDSKPLPGASPEWGLLYVELEEKR